MPELHPYHLQIDADADPVLPGRVLARLTVRNELPLHFAFRFAADALRIEALLAGGSVPERRCLANQLGAIASVRTVALSRGGVALSLDPAAA